MQNTNSNMLWKKKNQSKREKNDYPHFKAIRCLYFLIQGYYIYSVSILKKFQGHSVSIQTSITTGEVGFYDPLLPLRIRDH